MDIIILFGFAIAIALPILLVLNTRNKRVRTTENALTPKRRTWSFIVAALIAFPVTPFVLAYLFDKPYYAWLDIKLAFMPLMLVLLWLALQSYLAGTPIREANDTVVEEGQHRLARAHLVMGVISILLILPAANLLNFAKEMVATHNIHTRYDISGNGNRSATEIMLRTNPNKEVSVVKKAIVSPFIAVYGLLSWVLLLPYSLINFSMMVLFFIGLLLSPVGFFLAAIFIRFNSTTGIMFHRLALLLAVLSLYGIPFYVYAKIVEYKYNLKGTRSMRPHIE